MGMHEGIERCALLKKSHQELVDIIMDMRYGPTYVASELPLQRCRVCGIERRGVSEVNLAHTIEEFEPDTDGHHIGIKAKRTWCYGPWDFVKEADDGL